MIPVPRPAAFVPFELGEIEHSIAARFERIASRHPDRPAVVCGATTLDYRALNGAADRVARALRAATGAEPAPVAVLLGQGADLIVAILGVLKAGHFYVPLDGSYPVPALEGLWADSGARAIVTDAAHRDLAARLSRPAPPIDVTRLTAEPGAVAPGRAPCPDDLAYIYYTSGTTGSPKGVTDTHRNVLHNVMRYTNGLHLSPTDRLTLLQAPMFSGAVSSLFGALLNGAAVCPYDVGADGVTGIGPWLIARRVTVYHSVPTIFRHFLRAVDERQVFPDVRVVRLEGDRATPADVDLFRRHFTGDSVLAHGLGATECGLVCRFVLGVATRFDGTVLPIGHPVEDMTVRIVGDDGAEVAAGEPGEIVVESRHLSPGYWRRPDLTAAAFGDGREPGTRRYRTGDVGRVRADGRVEHLGRRNLQPKVRGQRVDAEAIETALAGCDLVAEAVVEVRTGPVDEARIVAYVVPRPGAKPSSTALRRHLARTLPAHLIPARFVTLDALPLTANRKIDRVRLPDPDRDRPALDVPYVAASTGVEIQLAALWCEALGLDQVGVHDDFFELGGDSLGAMHVLERIDETCGVSLASQAMFETPTVAGLAVAVERARPGAGSDAPALAPRSPLIAVQPGGTRPPFFFLHAEYGGDGFYCLGLSRHLGADQPFFALSPHGRDGGDVPGAIETMAAEYVRVLRGVRTRGPYRLGGFCSSAAVAWEMGRQLIASGDAVDLLVLIEPPDVARGVRRRLLHAVVSAFGAARGLGPEPRAALVSAALRRAGRGGPPSWRDLRRTAVRLARPRAEPQTQRTPEQRRAHIARVYDRAVAAWMPRRFDGRVLCLRARDVPRLTPVDAWRGLAREFTNRLVPGDHDSCILQHAGSLAAALEEGFAAEVSTPR